MGPPARGAVRKSIETACGKLQALRTSRGTRLSPWARGLIKNLLDESADASKLHQSQQMRLLDRLKRARRDVGRQGVPVGAPQLSRVPPPRRICQKVDRFSFEAKESGLKWELRRLTSPDERVGAIIF